MYQRIRIRIHTKMSWIRNTDLRKCNGTWETAKRLRAFKRGTRRIRRKEQSFRDVVYLTSEEESEGLSSLGSFWSLKHDLMFIYLLLGKYFPKQCNKRVGVCRSSLLIVFFEVCVSYLFAIVILDSINKPILVTFLTRNNSPQMFLHRSHVKYLQKIPFLRFKPESADFFVFSEYINSSLCML